jgi:hypothetical protein
MIWSFLVIEMALHLKGYYEVGILLGASLLPSLVMDNHCEEFVIQCFQGLRLPFLHGVFQVDKVFYESQLLFGLLHVSKLTMCSPFSLLKSKIPKKLDKIYTYAGI